MCLEDTPHEKLTNLNLYKGFKYEDFFIYMVTYSWLHRLKRWLTSDISAYLLSNVKLCQIMYECVKPNFMQIFYVLRGYATRKIN